MSNPNSLQDILTASKAGINGLKAVQKKAESDLTALGKEKALFVANTAQGAAKLAVDGITAAGASVLKLIGDAESRATGNVWDSQQRAVDLINKGLAAIEEKHNQSIQQIHRKTDADLAAIRQAQDKAIAAIRAERTGGD